MWGVCHVCDAGGHVICSPNNAEDSLTGPNGVVARDNIHVMTTRTITVEQEG